MYSSSLRPQPDDARRNRTATAQRGAGQARRSVARQNRRVSFAPCQNLPPAPPPEKPPPPPNPPKPPPPAPPPPPPPPPPPAPPPPPGPKQAPNKSPTRPPTGRNTTTTNTPTAEVWTRALPTRRRHNVY